MNIRTKRGALRQYNAILRAYKRDYPDGGMLGFDWPQKSVRANDPQRYEQLRRIRAIYGSLPE